MSLITGVRVIDHQEQPGVLLEIVEGPDHRRVRFFVRVAEMPQAYSQVWTGSEWKPVHHLLDPGYNPGEALARLFKTTEDILGWGTEEPCPSSLAV